MQQSVLGVLTVCEKYRTHSRVKLPVSIDIICFHFYNFEINMLLVNIGFYSVQFKNVSYQNLM